MSSEQLHGSLAQAVQAAQAVQLPEEPEKWAPEKRKKLESDNPSSSLCKYAPHKITKFDSSNTMIKTWIIIQ